MNRFLTLGILTISTSLVAQYDTVQVGITTTVHLYFQSDIIKADVGSGIIKMPDGTLTREVHADIPADNPQRLKLAASLEYFETTNLFIETEEAVYNFILVYDEFPQKLFHAIRIEQASMTKNKRKDDRDKEEIEQDGTTDINKLTELCSDVINQKADIIVGEMKQKITFFVSGIYTDGDHIFIRVNIRNSGSVKFDLNYVGFFIKDKKSSGINKSPEQHEPLSPLYVMNEEINEIEKGEEITKVFAFEKFTIENKKKLHIEFWEGRGERKFELRIGAREVLGATEI